MKDIKFVSLKRDCIKLYSDKANMVLFRIKPKEETSNFPNDSNTNWQLSVGYTDIILIPHDFVNSDNSFHIKH